MIIPTELVDEEFKGEASPRTGAPARKSSRASVTAHSFLGSQKSMRNSFMAVANSAAYQSEVAELLEVYDANGDGSYCKDVRVFHPIPPSKTTCSRNSCAPPRAPRGVPRIFCHFSERPTCFYPPRRPPRHPQEVLQIIRDVKEQNFRAQEAVKGAKKLAEGLNTNKVGSCGRRGG